jgi:hypothetical protein
MLEKIVQDYFYGKKIGSIVRVFYSLFNYIKPNLSK